MKRNRFIVAALEELGQEVADGAQTPIVIDTPAEAAAQTGASAVNLDQGVDAVAALMEKNAELATENVELQEEVFDNDADVIEGASDSVKEDLEEAAACGAALEELAHLADLTVKSGQANKASVAGLAFAMEQICERLGLSSPIPALEDAADVTDVEFREASPEKAKEAAGEQAKGIGEKAKALAIKIGKMLADGIKRIMEWVFNFFRQLFTRTTKIAAKARELEARVKSADASKTIDDKGFIKSLRLPADMTSVADEYHNFGAFVDMSVTKFFNTEFAGRISDIHQELGKTKGESSGASFDEVKALVEEAWKTIFTVRPQEGQIPAGKMHDDTRMAVTPALVGGFQLYLGFYSDTSDPWDMKIESGRCKEPELAEPESIPVLAGEDGARLLRGVARWMDQFRDLEKRMKEIKRLGEGYKTAEVGFGYTIHRTYNSAFLKLLATFATGIMPQLLHFTLVNSQRIISYAEKSLQVSGAQAEKK